MLASLDIVKCIINTFDTYSMYLQTAIYVSPNKTFLNWNEQSIGSSHQVLWLHYYYLYFTVYCLLFHVK